MNQKCFSLQLLILIWYMYMRLMQLMHVALQWKTTLLRKNNKKNCSVESPSPDISKRVDTYIP